ncbi:MAG TPA: metabolite traffic protein EboE [Planctomycetota bacterium]|nr:metabolite traffic protein EboE [Planctomycetota bacterium]
MTAPTDPPATRPPEAVVTYCGNVHPGESLAEWLEGHVRAAAGVARASATAGPFPLGVWWPAPVARELAAGGEALACARAALGAHRLAVATANAFPYGGFHDAVVKTAVYRPDWADPRRATFTLDVARAACALAAPGAVVPISTLPLGFGGGDQAAMRRSLAEVAARLAALEAETGVCCVLALEPEPDCLVETAAQALTLIQDVRRTHGETAAVVRHLGVCLDLCHLAVVGEDALAALAALRAAGVPVPKVQVSSCLEARGPSGLERLLGWAEPRYLHQTSAVFADGGRARVLDLDEVRARKAEFARAERVRTHFHVPVFWDEDGELGSTRREVERFLAGLTPPWPLLEIETYTWGVLPGLSGREEDLIAGLAREIAFVRQHLARAGA